MIVRWGLDALPDVLSELSVGDPLLIASGRWSAFEVPGVRRRFHGVQPHAEVTGVRDAMAACDGADGLTRFKRGWSPLVRPSYLGRHVACPRRYAELCRDRPATDFFPAYRYINA